MLLAPVLPCVSFGRLILLTRRLPPEPAASLQQDFDSALAWLDTNQDMLKSKWSVFEASKRISDLDERLTTAFVREDP